MQCVVKQDKVVLEKDVTYDCENNIQIKYTDCISENGETIVFAEIEENRVKVDENGETDENG